MDRKVFNIDINVLDEKIAKDISYVYTTFAPDKENRVSKMKSKVFPWAAHYVRFIDQQRVGDVEKGVFVSPYNLLNEKISKDIEEFYTSIWKRYDMILSPYGERADKIREQFRMEFSKAIQTTEKAVLEKVNLCVISGADANKTIDEVLKVLEKRKETLQKHMKAAYL